MRPTTVLVHRTCRAALAFGIFVAMPMASRAQQSPTGGSGRDMGGGRCALNVYNCADTPNPLPAPATVWLEEMTWMDVRDAIRAGKTTVIVPTGGVEPNGPWLVTGKHNHVLRITCEAVARKLGNALCAPILKLVPEGRIDPPSGHMTSPGTISLREETFRAVLTDVVHSLKQHGFETVILIGDSGGNQAGQRFVADSLTRLWQGRPVVAHIQEYYDSYRQVAAHMEGFGLRSVGTDNLHDDAMITLSMFLDDPRSVRFEERLAAGTATIDGVSLADRERNVRWGRQIVDFRADVTVAAIARAIASKGTPSPPPAGR